MAKTKNDPAAYRKRADQAKQASVGGSKVVRELTDEQKRALARAFGSGKPGASYVPFTRVVGK